MSKKGPFFFRLLKNGFEFPDLLRGPGRIWLGGDGDQRRCRRGLGRGSLLLWNRFRERQTEVWTERTWCRGTSEGGRVGGKSREIGNEEKKKKREKTKSEHVGILVKKESVH